MNDPGGTNDHRLEPAAVAAAVEPLLDGFASRAEASDRDRRIPPESAEALASVGAHRLLQPARFGGAEATIRDHVATVALVARGCPATAWCLAVWSVHNWMLAHFDPQAQTDVWGADPAALISASIVPRTPSPDREGILVEGRFPFGSGSDHAAWLLVGGLVERGGPPEPVYALVPRQAVHIDQDSWHVSGLRGTGSKDIVIQGPVEVPWHRVLFTADAVERRAPGQLAHPVPLYLAPYRPAATIVLAPPALGAARAAVTRFVERMPGHFLFLSRALQRDDPAARLRLAQATADVDAAELVLLAAAALIDELGHREEPSGLEEAKTLRDTAYAVRLCASAVDLLFEASGGSALAEVEPLQRLWREVHAARAHAVLTWDAAALAYASAALD